uniref:ORF27 n=1 Tax=Malaco herpesvirus 4 TaxID=3031800 RepID=A0AA48P8Z6_9VIRU|nr:TPA_asm: ORF27 [Malaco herpesvirus 4]
MPMLTSASALCISCMCLEASSTSLGPDMSNTSDMKYPVSTKGEKVTVLLVRRDPRGTWVSLFVVVPLRIVSLSGLDIIFIVVTACSSRVYPSLYSPTQLSSSFLNNSLNCTQKYSISFTVVQFSGFNSWYCIDSGANMASGMATVCL